MRGSYLVFGQPLIEDAEIEEVVKSLRAAWLGTGPKVSLFEKVLAEYKGMRQGETGYLCEEGDISEMAEVLCGLAQRRDSAIGLVTQGRKHIETHFSLRTQLQKLGQIYGSLTGEAA
jgi:glycosyltransferase involved in cell wall biosynthesis